MPRLLIDGTALSRSNKGVGRYTYHLCLQATAKLQHWDIVIAVFPNDLPDFPGDFRASFAIVPAASDLVRGLFLIPRLIRGVRPDVLLRPMESVGYDYGIPMITVCHDISELIRRATRQPRGWRRTLIDGINERLRIHAMRKSALLVCNSAFIQEAAIARYGIPRVKTAVGYCGIDSRFYSESPTVQADIVRRKYNVPRYLLTFATGDYREGFDLLPEIAHGLRAANVETCMLVAGIKAGAGYAEILRGRFLALGLIEGKDFVFEGFLAEDRFADLVALYTAADFYLELSWHEGFGMQLAEAMACGTTCISTGAGALTEVAGEFAIGIDAGNAGSVVAAVTRAYEDGLHLRDNRAQIEFSRRYDWNGVGILVTQFVERIAAERCNG